MASEAKAGPEGAANDPCGTAANAQAHLVKPAKSPVPVEGQARIRFQTRDWSLFVFFRIMAQVEVDELDTRLCRWCKRAAPMAEAAGGRSASLHAMMIDLAQPSLMNAGLVEDRKREEAAACADPQAEKPAKAFLDWLNVLVAADASGFIERAAQLHAWHEEKMRAEAGVEPVPAAAASAAAEGSADAAAEGSADAATEGGADGLDALVALIARRLTGDEAAGFPAAGQWLHRIQEDLPRAYFDLLTHVRAGLGTSDNSPFGSPLFHLLLYEVLRQAAPAFTDGPPLPVVRSEAAESNRKERDERFDRTPVTVAFSYQGLKALNLDQDTLASFPDAFKEGMAARARRLRDTGASAPEHWAGTLGLDSIHGYLAAGSNLGRDWPVAESFWETVRKEVRAFNDRDEDWSIIYRALIGFVFGLIGLEVMHIEIGQDPYEVDNDKVRALPHRKEHFGFRDGLSQPFVDLKLGDTLPGGGTPSRRSTWTPVAPGEIFLDRADEGGSYHLLPFSEKLRRGSTYLVFRKLDQDVYGFRSFLREQRPESGRARDKLAAQLVGRWKNGTSLVRSPGGPRAVEGEAEAVLNDFRYAADDPHGRKCPLGAHVRRANPRDIGGRNDVRHHRILRRGISFGGPLLREGEADDGKSRGILFIAACARVDIQFEVVQADWLNGGEFLGQAGLGRCPVTGTPPDNEPMRFLEAGAVAPVSGLPRFVTMRGGDYFFAPGICALKGIAAGETFKPDPGDIPYPGFSMGTAATPTLFGEDRLARYGERLLCDRTNPGVIRVQAKPAPVMAAAATAAAGPETIAFVGRYQYVTEILRDRPNANQSDVNFSAQPYYDAGLHITRGQVFPVGTDQYGPTSRTREFQFRMLNLAWGTLAGWLKPDLDTVRRTIIQDRVDMALRRTAGARTIDLVDDLASSAAYGVIDRLYGLPGPRWLTELAVALPFSRQHVGELPADWIAAMKGEKPADPGFTTMQIWMAIITADLVANVKLQRELQALASQAGLEALNHIDIKLIETVAAGQAARPTLIKAFVAIATDPNVAQIIAAYYRVGVQDKHIWGPLYLKDVAVILLEILGATLIIVPFTFASVMTTLLKYRIDLPSLLDGLKKAPDDVRDTAVTQLIHEAERLTPNVAMRTRRCNTTTNFGNGKVEKGDVVAALISAANFDPRRHAFPQPFRFSLRPYYPGWKGPRRVLDRYLLFGVQGTTSDPSFKKCWGRDYVALPILKECIYACGRLEGLRRVAGRRGEPQKLAGVTIGLAARFARVRAK